MLSKCVVNNLTPNSSQNTKRLTGLGLQFPFYTWINWGPGRWRGVSKLQLLSDRGGIGTLTESSDYNPNFSLSQQTVFPIITPLHLQVGTGGETVVWDPTAEVRNYRRWRCRGDFPMCSPPRRRPCQTKALVLRGKQASPMVQSSHQQPKEEGLGIKLGEWRKRAGRDCVVIFKAPESQKGEVQFPFRSNFRSMKRWWLYFIAPRFPLASWGQPSPAGEGGPHQLLDSLERKGLGWALGWDLTSSVTRLPPLDITHLLKEILGLEELWGLAWGAGV